MTLTGFLFLPLGCADNGTSDDSSATGSASDTSGCAPEPNPNPEHICCDGASVDPRSDLFHCGGCGSSCTAPTPFCDQGTCVATLCEDACSDGQICCTLNGPVETGPGCVTPEAGNCPPGCAPLCKCAAPETLIATPTGERPIAALEPGDLVYSVDGAETTAVPVARVQRVRVRDHHVVRAVLDDGHTLRITPSHPLADGRAFGDVRVGQRLGHAVIVEAETVEYDEPFTHDILPMSSTATYFVAGELVESTMRLR